MFFFAAILLQTTCLVDPVLAADPSVRTEESTKTASTAKTTSVALTTTADKASQGLAGSLLALMELNVSQLQNVTVVERMQIGLALRELVIDREADAGDRDRLQLGKLTVANLIVNAEFLKSDPKTKTQHVMVRIADSLTGAIRGLTVAPVDALTVDVAAEQIAGYLSAVIRNPKQAGVTVAVAAFDSQGRFDRLRPLELGVRDMLTARLTAFDQFQVLQRSSMKQLLFELDLIRSGFTDNSQLPVSLPGRAAAYLVRGTLDERNVDEKFRVVVSGEVVHAVTLRVIDKFRIEVEPKAVPEALGKQVDRIAARIAAASKLAPDGLRQLGFDETKYLFAKAIRDVRRFRRLIPIDFSYRNFQLPGQPVSRAVQRTVVNPDSVLGRHLLRKSIDRLESLLFIEPDHMAAAYALGFCYTFHVDKIWNADRADELLRQVFKRDPQGDFAPLALRWLSESSFHHQRGRVNPTRRKQAAEQLMFAFENMPAAHRSHRWARLLELLSGLQGPLKDFEGMARSMRTGAATAEQTNSNRRYPLAMGTSSLAMSLVRSARQHPQLQAEAKELLTRWSEGKQDTLRHIGSRGLAILAAARKDFPAATKHYEHAAATYDDSFEPRGKAIRQNFLVYAARNYRFAGDPQRGVDILKTFKPKPSSTSLGLGYYSVELGACYEALGKKKEALEIYLTIAEQDRHIVDNSDVVRRIKRLGGVPLREDRDLDVRYLTGPDKRPYYCRALATDGRRLFCGSGYRGKHAAGIMVLDLASESWEVMKPELGRVTCLAYDKGHLWAGTENSGLWRCQMSVKKWRQWSSDQGFADKRVESVTAHGQTAYVGVGSSGSGGLVHVDGDGRIHIYDGKDAPEVAPTHIVVEKDRILARTNRTVHEYKTEDESWKRLKSIRWVPRIYAGKSGVWGSMYGRELYKFDSSGKINKDQSAAWFAAKKNNKAGYWVKFVIEHDGQIWFGGSPWARFLSSGFYRLDQETAKFTMYGPRDGFRLSSTYDCHDGVWAAGRLWIATAAGLAEVRVRNLAE